MIYKVRYDEFALKQLKKMDRATKELIISYIEKKLSWNRESKIKRKTFGQKFIWIMEI